MYLKKKAILLASFVMFSLLSMVVNCQSKANECFSFDKKYIAYAKEISPYESSLTVYSNDASLPQATFTKHDFDKSLADKDIFKINSVSWAKRDHKILAVEISGEQWTDVKLAYLDEKTNQWSLINLGPSIGYFEPSWVKEDKMLVTYAGSEDEYGICIYDFERHSMTYFVPYKGSIKYDCQGVAFQNDVGTIKNLKYSKIHFPLGNPKINEKNVWLADKTAVKKSNRFIEKVAHFQGNDRRYLCGKDFYYFDFLGYVDIPVKNEYTQCVSYALPTKDRGIAGLKDWTGFVFAYSFDDNFQYKGFDMAMDELEESIKRTEIEKMLLVEIKRDEVKQFENGDIKITIRDTSPQGRRSESNLELQFTKGNKQQTITLTYTRSDDDNQWWNPTFCIEKEPAGIFQLFAIKYIGTTGLCTDIYTIKGKK